MTKKEKTILSFFVGYMKKCNFNIKYVNDSKTCFVLSFKNTDITLQFNKSLKVVSITKDYTTFNINLVECWKMEKIIHCLTLETSAKHINAYIKSVLISWGFSYEE